MYREVLGGHILLVYSWIEELFILTIPAFEGLHDDNIICSYKMPVATQRKLFKAENEGSGEREQTIAIVTRPATAGSRPEKTVAGSYSCHRLRSYCCDCSLLSSQLLYMIHQYNHICCILGNTSKTCPYQMY